MYHSYIPDKPLTDLCDYIFLEAELETCFPTQLQSKITLPFYLDTHIAVSQNETSHLTRFAPAWPGGLGRRSGRGGSQRATHAKSSQGPNSPVCSGDRQSDVFHLVCSLVARQLFPWGPHLEARELPAHQDVLQGMPFEHECLPLIKIAWLNFRYAIQNLLYLVYLSLPVQTPKRR